MSLATGEFSTEYFTESASVTQELMFLYDESGMIGFTHSRNGATPLAYYYQRNLQGDVVGIYDTRNGAIKQIREYDGYGKPRYDIDYDHPQKEHIFPHIHYWDWSQVNPRGNAEDYINCKNI